MFHSLTHYDMNKTVLSVVAAETTGFRMQGERRIWQYVTNSIIRHFPVRMNEYHLNFLSIIKPYDPTGYTLMNCNLLKYLLFMLLGTVQA